MKKGMEVAAETANFAALMAKAESVEERHRD